MKATERTLEQELTPLLKTWLGADTVNQTSVGGGKGRQQYDTILTFSGYKIVLELEVGGESKLLEGVVQAESYVSKLGADGSITIAYPESTRVAVDTGADVLDLVQESKVSSLVLTPFLRQRYTNIKVKELAERIKSASQKPEPTDLTLLVGVLREAVESLATKIRRSKGISMPAIERVINQFELFQTLATGSEDPDPDELSHVASDLAAYIVVNQILLYFLLRNILKLPDMNVLEKIPDLRRYFKRVTDIDYKAVYVIDIIDELSKDCLNEVNRVIVAFRQLKPHGVEHDLLGRMFHEFLPFKTRKLFATFYTKPVAAELLARMAIQQSHSTIIEPSCGSGTLLVASYKALRRRHPELKHKDALRQIHASDIMPFAAHLAALNLTLQDIEETTEKVNVSVGNSLDLAANIQGFKTQQDMFQKLLSRKVDVEQIHDEEADIPEHSDIVIMNPPFTDARRLTNEMLGNRAGAFENQQNYWAYFLSLADDLLKPGGVIAAVLPRLFIAGSASKEVRKKLFVDWKYDLLYVVRTTKEFAFSEAAAFRDFLIIAKKPGEDKTKSRQPCKVVYLNRSIEEISVAEAGDIADEIVAIRTKKAETEDFEIFTVPQKAIHERADNLWFLAGFENPRNSELVSKALSRVIELGPSRITTLREAIGIRSRKSIGQIVPRGFEPKPKGLYDAIFVVRPHHKKRTHATDMVLNKELKTSLKGGFRTKTVTIPRENTVLGIKTGSYFPSLEITQGNGDFVLTKRCADSSQIHRLSGVRVNYDYVRKGVERSKAHLLVRKRFNIVAPGTSLLAFFSSEGATSPNTFYCVRTDKPKSLMLAVWINSIFGVLQVLLNRMETEGGYCDVLKEDLIEFFVPADGKLPTEIQTWFKKNKAMEFPKLSDQFEVDSVRWQLDKMVMSWIGWPKNEIDDDLRELYQVVNEELALIRDAMKRKRKVRGNPTAKSRMQTSLLDDSAEDTDE